MYIEMSKGKRAYKKMEPWQIEFLESEFESGNFWPTREDREKMGERIAVDQERIRVWFQNLRSKRGISIRNKESLHLSYEKSKKEDSGEGDSKEATVTWIATDGSGGSFGYIDPNVSTPTSAAPTTPSVLFSSLPGTVVGNTIPVSYENILRHGEGFDSSSGDNLAYTYTPVIVYDPTQIILPENETPSAGGSPGSSRRGSVQFDHVYIYGADGSIIPVASTPVTGAESSFATAPMTPTDTTTQLRTSDSRRGSLPDSMMGSFSSSASGIAVLELDEPNFILDKGVDQDGS